MNGSSKQQPRQTPMQARATSNPGGSNVFYERFKVERLPGGGDVWIKDRFLDPSKMAEPKDIVRARVEGFEAGRVYGRTDGYRKGLACGIFCTAVFFITVYATGKVIG